MRIDERAGIYAVGIYERVSVDERVYENGPRVM